MVKLLLMTVKYSFIHVDWELELFSTNLRSINLFTFTFTFLLLMIED